MLNLYMLESDLLMYVSESDGSLAWNVEGPGTTLPKHF